MANWSEKELLLEKIDARKMVLAQKEKELAKLKSKLTLSYLKAQQMVSLTDESKRKAMLLQLNARKLQGDLAQCREVSAIAKMILEYRQTKLNNDHPPRLEQVKMALQELLQHFREPKESATDEEKLAAQLSVRQRLSPFSAAEIWSGVADLQQEMLHNLETTADNVDIKGDLEDLRQELVDAGISVNMTGMEKLAALCLKLHLEKLLLSKKNLDKQQQLAELKKQLEFALAGWRSSTSTTSTTPSKDVQKWVELYLQKLALQTRTAAIKEKIQVLNLEAPDLSYREWKFSKQVQIIVANNAKLENLQQQVEQSLQRLQSSPLKLTALQERALQELSNFSLDSLELLAENVAKLAGAEQKEVKAFMDCPLIALRRTTLSSGLSIPTYQMLTQYRHAVPSIRVETLLEGASLGSMEDVVLNLFEKKRYHVQLNKELEEGLPIVGLGDDEVSQKHREELLKELQESHACNQKLVSDLQLSAISSEELMAKLRSTLYAWRTHPFVNAIPTTMQVEGRTLHEWMDKYRHGLEILDEDDSLVYASSSELV